MVIHIKRNFILNSDNVCYAKIIADEEKGLTNKMQISLVSGEKVLIDFTSVEVCKKCFEHIASAIQGSIVDLDLDKDKEETRLFYSTIKMVK